MSTFEKEIAVFGDHLAEWLEEGHEGEWVAIHSDKVLKFFLTVEAAYSAGVSEFGDETEFLVREVTSHDEPEILHRVWAIGSEPKRK